VSDDLAEYCRQVEAYLCGKNDGHLIRIVGPAFEMVCGWARQGIPLKIAFRGIDQYFERYYAKGSRRRPVRIEFCEADILDSFDGWRRAVGVAQAAGDDQPGPVSRPPGLASHIERVIARLTALRAGDRRWEFDAQIAEAVRELDGLVPGARRARGAARAAIVEHLAALDRRLTDAAIAALDAEASAELRIEAERELAAFAERMPTDAHARAVTAAFERLARESASLPSVRYE
jgi:hypothetical protein